MRNAELSIDPFHMKKNMGLKMKDEKAVVISMYGRAVRAPSKNEMDKIISEYGVRQQIYLAQFPRSELNRAH